MSDVNKLDSTQCSFDPEQYQYKKTIDVEVDNVAPDGSFPWALIQVYVGKLVRRNGWDAQVEYIKLLPASTENNTLPQIEVTDKEGTTPWQPIQEDMIACDWKLLESVCPEDNMLEFDLEIGVGGSDLNWGYLADDEFVPTGEHPFGTLTNLQNKTDIKTFSYFVGWNNDEQLIDVRVSSGNNQEGYQKMKELFGKDLTVIANGVPYSLGRATEGNLPGQKKYEFVGRYFYGNAGNAIKLNTLLKQNVGNTLHFCFHWK
ncbi:MW1434 family type I TA system toxin [Xenorhabdus sp. TH1]|uniref:Thoeris anti-defense Tad2 family protein n=1 Tax=Xenorhabdus sp. TH1 TaxID=3130166 RepID=UPI0030CDB74D